MCEFYNVLIGDCVSQLCEGLAHHHLAVVRALEEHSRYDDASFGANKDRTRTMTTRSK